MNRYAKYFLEAMEDANKFTAKLQKGIDNLMQIEEIKIGQTEKELVFQDGKRKLYHYQPRAEEVCPMPVLIVYALVNRYTMLDLQPDRSIVRNLLERGMDLYVIDWGYADRMDRFMTMEDYIDGFLNDSVDFICKGQGREAINLLGVCQGGTFSSIYSALYPEKVKNLISLVTPIDFATNEGLLNVWAAQFDVDLMVDAYGNIPGDVMNCSYQMIQPLTLSLQKYINMVEIMDDSNKMADFIRMETWIFDSPAQPGETVRKFLKDLYQDNKLIKGEFELGGRRVDLKNITMPVLNIYAEFDTLVPPSSSKALLDYVGADDVEEVTFPVGHIGMFVSGKTQKNLAPKIAAWIKDRV